MTLKFGNAESTAASPGNFMPIALPTWDGESTGGSDYQANITGCNGVPVKTDTMIDDRAWRDGGTDGARHGRPDRDSTRAATWNRHDEAGGEQLRAGGRRRAPRSARASSRSRCSTPGPSTPVR